MEAACLKYTLKSYAAYGTAVMAAIGRASITRHGNRRAPAKLWGQGAPFAPEKEIPWEIP